MNSSERQLRALIREELSKDDVKKLIDDKLTAIYKKADFEKAVKEITSDVLSNLFRYMYNQRGFMKGGF